MITTIAWTLGIVGALALGLLLLVKRYKQAAYLFFAVLAAILIIKGCFACAPATPPKESTHEVPPHSTYQCSPNGRCTLEVML